MGTENQIYRYISKRLIRGIYIYTWPAEYLIYISQDVAQAAFDTPWYNQSIKIRKYLQIIIGRNQKPVIIAITGIMPTLSLNYFASYCSTVLSFFTTIRAFVNDEK